MSLSAGQQEFVFVMSVLACVALVGSLLFLIFRDFWLMGVDEENKEKLRAYKDSGVLDRVSKFLFDAPYEDLNRDCKDAVRTYCLHNVSFICQEHCCTTCQEINKIFKECVKK